MNEQNTDFNKSELIRRKYKLRKLILSGKIILPHKEASLLIGPDCAYHLYSVRDYARHKESTNDEIEKD